MTENSDNKALHEPAALDRLKVAVERALGRSPATPADFACLAAEIASRSEGRDAVSQSTLKRLWGYVRSGHRPSTAVLSVLARFCGYTDWAHFESSAEADSGFLVMTPLTPDMLREGDLVEITWAPDRSATLRYAGGREFEVMASANAKLLPGDTLTTTLFCRGYPMYATAIRRGSAVIPAYVAGRRGGLLTVSRKIAGWQNESGEDGFNKF